MESGCSCTNPPNRPSRFSDRTSDQTANIPATEPASGSRGRMRKRTSDEDIGGAGAEALELALFVAKQQSLPVRSAANRVQEQIDAEDALAVTRWEHDQRPWRATAWP